MRKKDIQIVLRIIGKIDRKTSLSFLHTSLRPGSIIFNLRKH